MLQKYALSMLAGLLLCLSFAPYHFYLLAFIAPAALYLLSDKTAPKQSFYFGFCFGLGFFGLGVYWLYISFHDYGQIPLLAALFLTFLFIAFLSLFQGVQMYLLNYFFTPSKTKLFLAFPSLWVLTEWFRSHFCSGFPWLLLGYSQTPSNLRGYLPLIGTYGLSYLIVFISALLIFFLKDKKIKIIPFSAIIVSIWALASWSLHHEWTRPFAKPIQVGLVQGNIDQSLKWSESFYQETQTIYEDLSAQTKKMNLIVWPENAITLPLPQSSDFVERLDQYFRRKHIGLIAGLPIMGIDDNTYYNAAISLGRGQGKYAKQHLVPFSESDPTPRLSALVKKWLNLPEGAIIPGHKKQGNLSAAGLLINPTICYEVAYSDIIRQFAATSHLLMTISNDAWFGQSSAPWQHLQIVQARALETGRYAITSANTGITAIIDQKGHILKWAAPFKRTVLEGSVQGMSGLTPWLRLGDTPILCLAFMVFAAALFRAKRKI